MSVRHQNTDTLRSQTQSSSDPEQHSPNGPPRLALLSNGVSPHNDNHQRITDALQQDGWEVSVFSHSSLAMMEQTVCAGATPLDTFDLVWMLGLGEQYDFLDRCQILNNLPPEKLVNSPMATAFFHSKHANLPHSPLTFTGGSPKDLVAAATRHPEVAQWVVKPSAGSYGRGVVLVSAADNLERALKSSTKDGRYCVLQAYVEEIVSGETRSLWVNGSIIGSYLRIPDRNFLANLSQGARPRPVILDSQQVSKIQDIGNYLSNNGIRFAAIDMAFPWLIEINVANPGGLATLSTLESSTKPSVNQRLAQALRTLLN